MKQTRVFRPSVLRVLNDILTAKKVLKIKETRTKQNSDENVKKR